MNIMLWSSIDMSIGCYLYEDKKNVSGWITEISTEDGVLCLFDEKQEQCFLHKLK